MTKPLPGSIRELEYRFRDRIELARSCLSGPPHGGLAVPVPDSTRKGEFVSLRIELASAGIWDVLQGMVLWLRRIHGRQTMAGIGFFQDEAGRRDRLLGTALPAFPGRNERREKRFDATFTVTYQSAEAFGAEHTRNLSAGGCFIVSRHPPEPGTDLRLRLHLPDGDVTLDLEAQVTWRRTGEGFGVRWVEPEQGERQILDRLIRRLASHGS